MQILDLRSQIADFIDSLVQLGNSIIHLHGQSELLLQRCLLSFVSRIDRQMKRSSLRFAATVSSPVSPGNASGPFGPVLE